MSHTDTKVRTLRLNWKVERSHPTDNEDFYQLWSYTGERLHNETVKALLSCYFFWRYAEFRDLISYPVPADPQARRLEMVKLRAQGWSEQTVAVLIDHPRAPHTVRRKVYFGTISAVLTLQEKYGHAGWFRIQGYLERDSGRSLTRRGGRPMSEDARPRAALG